MVKKSVKKKVLKKKVLHKVSSKRNVSPKKSAQKSSYKPLQKSVTTNNFLANPLARKHDEDKAYPDEDEEQGISPLKTSLQKKEEMETGDADEDLDTTVGREKQVEEDEVEPWEAGFAEGASDEGIHGKDALTGEPLMGAENVIETEIEGKNYRFASEENAERFLERMKKGKTKR